MTGVRLHIAGPVAELRLDNPAKLNCFTVEMLSQLASHLEVIEGRPEVRAVIVTGEGEKAFCSGADISGPRPEGEPKTPPQNTLLDEFHWVGDQAKAVYHLDKPTIGAMNGVCAGAGMSLALSCDLRVGSENARFRSVFLERNLSPDSGMSWFLTRILGYSRAIDLILTSRDVAAEEAYRLGLLDRLVAHDRLMEESLALAHQITQWPPVAVRAAKRVTQQNLDKNLDDGLRNEAYHLEYGRKAKNDAREALAARMEKRTPKYTGT